VLPGPTYWLCCGAPFAAADGAVGEDEQAPRRRDAASRASRIRMVILVQRRLQNPDTR
jgi:hypothetical protein